MIIHISNMYKFYGLKNSRVSALKHIGLDIASGEMLSIMGPSGSGKSTLMNILGCLDRPTSGVYEFKGRDISSLNDNELAVLRNQYIGFVFQNFNLLSRSTALANVELPMVYAGIAARKRHNVAKELLEVVGLKDRMNHYPNELSGGQKQRVAIARALVNHPAVLLADEPTGNLDTRSGTEVIKLFDTLNSIGVTVVLVTHDRDVAVQTRRIVYVRDGEIVSDVSGSSIKKDQRVLPYDIRPGVLSFEKPHEWNGRDGF